MSERVEDAVQEAMLAAVRQWPAHGVPANPRAWLVTVARRRLTDELRSRSARRRRPPADSHHRVAAVRAHLLELAGDVNPARDEYRRAARLTLSRPEQRYLEARARRLVRSS